MFVAWQQTSVVKKRLSAVTFVPGTAAAAAAPTILYADRIGDCYQFSVPNAATSTQPVDITASSQVFGHLASMTDLVYTSVAGSGSGSGSGYVLSSDDEAQVRVSHYPQLYNIQSFFLHHKG